MKKSAKQRTIIVRDVPALGGTGFGSHAIKNLYTCERRTALRLQARDGDEPDTGFSSDAATIGTLVHRMIAHYWRGVADNSDPNYVDDMARISSEPWLHLKAVRAFEAWRKAAIKREWRPLHIEREFRHRALGVTARVDGVFELDSGVVIVADVKTSGRSQHLVPTTFDLQAAINTWLVGEWCRECGKTFGGFFHDRIEIGAKSVVCKLRPVLVSDGDVGTAIALAREAARRRDRLKTIDPRALAPTGLTHWNACIGCPGILDCREIDADFDFSI